MQVEYRIKTVTRSIITRFQNDGLYVEVKQVGPIYDNAEQAYQIAYALASVEAERRGFAPGDERMVYPTQPSQVATD